MCSLELPLEKGAPGKLNSTPILYPFCSFIHKKGEISYTPWGAGSGRERGEAGNSDRPVLWENEWVTYLDFTMRRLIYTHFQTEEIQIT